MTVFRTLANACELRPEQARLILVDANAHLAGGLHPVEIDLFGVGIGRR